MNQVPEKDFNGTLEGITLADIVQLACLERYERKLEVRGRDFHGVVYFSEGEIVHAETGDLTGNVLSCRHLFFHTGQHRTAVNTCFLEFLAHGIRAGNG